MKAAAVQGAGRLHMRRMGIDTYQEMVAYMRSDCHVCRSEGLGAQSRVEVHYAGKAIVATLNVVHGGTLGIDDVGFSEAAWQALGGADGDPVRVTHRPPEASFAAVRGKIFGRPFSADALTGVVDDIVRGRYSDIEMAALITACSGSRIDVAETVALTRAMVAAGEQLNWDKPLVADKHCVGGLPGNRTTLLVVPIVAACGLTIPKTSSRAITSPAGTADTMEVIAPVALTLAQMRQVVEREGGCVAWGGAVCLSPADDLLIRVERPLDLDSDGLLVASVLSKKIAAGSTHVMIDIPVGRTAKIRSQAAADLVTERMRQTGAALGIEVRTMVTDGTQPVGRGIGPALEANDVLAVLQNGRDAPADLRARALQLAGGVLEMGGKAAPGAGLALATATLDSGAAFRKFLAICEAQGGFRLPHRAAFRHEVRALHSGQVVAVDNRRLAGVAKLAGAPKAKAAGIEYFAPLGTAVQAGQTLYTIHAESPGELAYALEYATAQENMITIQQEP
jgi:thymidine phosphorylase